MRIRLEAQMNAQFEYDFSKSWPCYAIYWNLIATDPMTGYICFCLIWNKLTPKVMRSNVVVVVVGADLYLNLNLNLISNVLIYGRALRLFLFEFGCERMQASFLAGKHYISRCPNTYWIWNFWVQQMINHSVYQYKSLDIEERAAECRNYTLYYMQACWLLVRYSYAK